MPSRARRWDEAATLGSYFVDEANVCFTLYRQWIGDLNGYLRDKDVDRGRDPGAQRPGGRGRDAARRLALASAQAVGPLPLRGPGLHRGDLPRAARRGEARGWTS